MLSKKEVKFIQSLKFKKYRHRERCFLVEGRKNVQEVIQSDLNIQAVYASAETANDFKTPNLIVLKAKEITQISTLVTNEEALAVVEIPEEKPLNPLETLFVLDGLRDPGNLGTILRTLDWFGFTQVLCSPDTVDLYNPKTVAATMGSISRVQVVYAEIPNTLEELGLPVFGATIQGSPLPSVNFPDPIAMVIGSESHGIRSELMGLLRQEITIPGARTAESLNAAMACGIIAYQLSLH